jgi:uncharacterized protein involved in outer membrane biogenesis
MEQKMNDATSQEGEKSVVRRIVTSKLFLIAVFSILIYTLAGFFLLPYILKSQLTRYVAEDLKRTLQIEKVRVNPYMMTLEISDLKLKEADGGPLLTFDRLFTDFELKSLFRWAWTFSNIHLDGWVLQVDIAPDKAINLARLAEDASPSDPDRPPPEPTVDSPPPRLHFERIQLVNGRIDLRDRSLSIPAEMSIKPINLDIKNLTTLLEKRGTERIVALLPHDGAMEWSGKISLNPIWSEGQFNLKNIHTAVAWDFLKEMLNIEAPGGVLSVEGHYRFDYTARAPELEVSGLSMQLDDLVLKVKDTPNASLSIDSIRLDKGRFDLAKMDLTVGQLALSGGSLSAAVEKDGRLSWENILAARPPGKTVANGNTAEDNAPPLQIHMENIALNDMSVKFEDHSRLHPVSMDLESFGITLKAEARISPRETQAVINEMGVDVNGLVLRQVGEAEKLLTLPQAAIRGGQVDLAARRISVKEFTLQGGEIAVWRTPKGDINLVQLTASGDVGAIRRQITKVKKTAEAEQHPWSIHLDALRMEKFGLKLSDRSLKAPKRYRFKNITLDIRDFQSPSKTPFDFNLALDIVEGGKAAVKGKVDIQAPKVTLSLKADDVALTPLKPYLNEFVTLSLDSGKVFVKGDVVYQKGKGGADALNFRGSGGIKKLALIRPESGKAFLAWNSLNAKGIRFNTLPGELLIKTVLLNRPIGQFIIKKDGSLNFEDVLASPRKTTEKTPPLRVKKAAPPKKDAKTFPVDVKQIRIQKAELEFADLSMMLPFGTRIHELSGVINGLSTAPDQRTVMAFEGQVNQYGSVKIKGELAPLNVKGYSDVAMVFRNVDMTRITPYSAKFAGRKIDSGKISLDLKYKIVGSRLMGENQIIVDSLKLGERVERSDAMDLPLDLAIALLEDSENRIQLGLPVSGSLDDPEFAYGLLVWKALVNVLTKIVTAPFTALASLMGHEEDLSTVNFEVGSPRITPPEAEKLAKLAAAIQQRPQLTIEVQGQYAAEADGAMLKQLAVRQVLAKRIGKTGVTDLNMDIEPLNTTDPAIQKALDALAGEGMDAAELIALKKTYGLEPSASEGEPHKPDPAGYCAALFKELVKHQPLIESALKVLAQERAAAVVSELTTAGGINATRLKTVETNGEGQVEKETVAIRLNLTAK